MAEIFDMDWAMHVYMYYAQNLIKDPVKAKKKDFHKFYTGCGNRIDTPSIT